MSDDKSKHESNLNIVSDGTPQGTKVLIDGKALRYVQSAKWEISSVDNLAMARIDLIKVPVELKSSKFKINRKVQKVPPSGKSAPPEWDSFPQESGGDVSKAEVNDMFEAELNAVAEKRVKEQVVEARAAGVDVDLRQMGTAVRFKSDCGDIYVPAIVEGKTLTDVEVCRYAARLAHRGFNDESIAVEPKLDTRYITKHAFIWNAYYDKGLLQYQFYVESKRICNIWECDATWRWAAPDYPDLNLVLSNDNSIADVQREFERAFATEYNIWTSSASKARTENDEETSEEIGDRLAKIWDHFEESDNTEITLPRSHVADFLVWSRDGLIPVGDRIITESMVFGVLNENGDCLFVAAVDMMDIHSDGTVTIPYRVVGMQGSPVEGYEEHAEPSMGCAVEEPECDTCDAADEDEKSGVQLVSIGAHTVEWEPLDLDAPRSNGWQLMVDGNLLYEVYIRENSWYYLTWFEGSTVCKEHVIEDFPFKGSLLKVKEFIEKDMVQVYGIHMANDFKD